MTISEKISAILRDPATGRINFQYAGVPVYRSGYARLAGAIERQHILVRIPQNPQAARIMAARGIASYDNRANTLYVPSIHYLETNSLHDKAQTVHEMTHALMDYHRRQMMKKKCEAVAYIAQLMYAHNNGIDNLNKYLTFSQHMTGDEADVFQAAWNIAHSILTTRGGYEVDRSSGLVLEGYIARHSLYHRIAQAKTNFDGI